MLVAALCSAVAQLVIWRTHTPQAQPPNRARLLVLTGTMAIAFVLAIMVPGAGPWALLLLIPAGMAHRLATTGGDGPRWTVRGRRR
jgi:hypothetical protein